MQLTVAAAACWWRLSGRRQMQVQCGRSVLWYAASPLLMTPDRQHQGMNWVCPETRLSAC